MKEAPFALGPPELGLTISAPLGVGLWAWGDRATWGYGSYDSAVSEQTFKAAYQASIDAGGWPTPHPAQAKPLVGMKPLWSRVYGCRV